MSIVRTDNAPSLSRTLSPAAKVYENARQALAIKEEINRVSSKIEAEGGFIWRLHQVMDTDVFTGFIEDFGKTSADMDILCFFIKLYQNIESCYQKKYSVKPAKSQMLFFMKRAMTNPVFRKLATEAYSKYKAEETTGFSFVERILVDERPVLDQESSE